MSVRMKLSHAKTRSRRAHHHAAAPTISGAGTAARLRHHVDLSTGMYRGKQILDTRASTKAVTGTKAAPVKGGATRKKGKENTKAEGK